ncbi:DUF2092 domain-containing protein [Blastochloris sulfoviridis]|uniref:DUF2092 domain-containing protein n=1 Tax=Blastochloris sulfoviridis TaxID=50712 RepID=A0A5M6I1P4_9HYPH|nr:DUF2092 domain-containing protein [Blastochloris sulfoviridis]KAA5602114.1 DUF2092 domain-containing protein [Blastochloris sulfoviridis]
MARSPTQTFRLAAAGLIILGSVGSVAAAPKPDAPPAPAALIDPAALDAFNRMSSYVAALPAFEFRTTYAFDVVARNGQTITVDGTGHHLAKRPDKLAVEVENDLFTRRYVYDGKTLVVVSAGEPYYAQVAAQPTIRDTLARAAAEYALEIPGADLFDFGTPHSAANHVSSAFVVGAAEVDGIAAEHLAFRSETRDWEVWIRAGDKPVPLKFTLIDRTQPAHPRTTVTFAWTDRSDIADTDFTFVPTGEQKRIDLQRIGGTQGGQ